MENKNANNEIILTTENNIVTGFPTRIDTSNAPDVEAALMDLAANQKVLILDFWNVDYISSAGIRTVLKLVKMKIKLTIINASELVYSTMDMVGMDEIVRIYRPLRDVSVENLKKIGQGGTAAVYQLDEDKIIKVYHPRYSRDAALAEKETARKLFLAGVPSAVPYEVVTCGEQIAVIYECLYSGTINDLLASASDEAEEALAIVASVCKEMNSIEMTDEYPSSKQQNMDSIQMWAEHGLIKAEETPKYLSYIEAIPDSNAFIHGDFHPGNVMKNGNELMLIDLATVARGHVVFDLAGCCTYLYCMPMLVPAEYYIAFTSINPEAAKAYWKVFLNAYFDGKDAAFIEKAEKQICTVSMMRMVSGKIFAPQLFTDESIEKAIEYINENGAALFSGFEF